MYPKIYFKIFFSKFKFLKLFVKVELIIYTFYSKTQKLREKKCSPIQVTPLVFFLVQHSERPL